MSTYKFKFNITIISIFISLLLSACTQSTFSGYVNDFDSNKPIKNVNININGNKTQTDCTGYFSLNVKSKSNCIISLKREGYESKKVYRKPDISKRDTMQKRKNTIIYMFRKDSEFLRK
ncbi:carboxypeptidase-like regulatory domain-containing protein [Flavobacterium sp. 2]|uniref:carboxypeptidase-like regulatory domain-containing protein n=1 Tax=Flavobacterium sp. 2 TaxID=308053 RepID=UPI003CEF883B